MALRIYEEAVVVLTGGASGIGHALAVQLAHRGATVLLADRDVEGVKRVAEAIGDRAEAHACDVTDPVQVQHVVDRAFDAHGRLDFLFNNAGIGIGGTIEEYTLEHWSQVLDVNLRGVVHGVHTAYPRMVEQGFGHIVNTASMAGFMPTPGFVSYGTSKHAVVGLSAGLRIEAARHGVRVTALCPGFVRTPILEGGKYGGHVDQDVDPNALREAAERVRAMDVDVFADKVVRMLARNPRVIVLPRYWNLVRWVQRTFPGLTEAVYNRLYAYQQGRLRNG